MSALEPEIVTGQTPHADSCIDGMQAEQRNVGGAIRLFAYAALYCDSDPAPKLLQGSSI
jgi:hypothetical protein